MDCISSCIYIFLIFYSYIASRLNYAMYDLDFEDLYLGDYFYAIFCGQLDKDHLISDVSIRPAFFLFIYIIIIFFSLSTLSFFSSDLFGYGQQIIFRIKKRKIWLTNKLLCYLYIVIYIYCFGFLF